MEHFERQGSARCSVEGARGRGGSALCLVTSWARRWGSYTGVERMESERLSSEGSVESEPKPTEVWGGVSDSGEAHASHYAGGSVFAAGRCKSRGCKLVEDETILKDAECHDVVCIAAARIVCRTKSRAGSRSDRRAGREARVRTLSRCLGSY